MMATHDLATRPTRPSTGDALENVIHLVCGCQLDDQGRPLSPPVLTLCGYRDSDTEPTPPGKLPLCPMCLESFPCTACKTEG